MRLLTGLFAMLMVSVALPAKAEQIINYELTGAATASWTINTGAPLQDAYLGYPVYDVSATVNGVNYDNVLVSLFPSSDLGGVEMDLSIDGGGGHGTFFSATQNPYAPDIASVNYGQLYTGPASDPTLLTGEFNFFEYGDWVATNFAYPLPSDVYHLSATVSAAPEPAAWVLMICGCGVLGGALRMARRKNDASKARPGFVATI